MFLRLFTFNTGKKKSILLAYCALESHIFLYAHGILHSSSVTVTRWSNEALLYPLPLKHTKIK